MSGQSQRRIEHLLATRVTQGLSGAEERSLEGLLRQHPEIDPDGLELAAAAVYEALAPAPEPLPDRLRAAILADGRREIETRVDEEARGGVVHGFPDRSARSTPTAPRLGWWVAAASLALAVAGWWPRAPTAETSVEAAGPLVEQRRRLVAEAPDVRLLSWSATEDRAAARAGGDVVWSPSRQRGYMRIRGLEPNDPAVAQYQLWIFDRQRDERYPVDGGVFDVPAGSDETIVPIDAKIPVDEPYLFAVTVEAPGGVVVSDRERIVLVAEA